MANTNLISAALFRQIVTLGSAALNRLTIEEIAVTKNPILFTAWNELRYQLLFREDKETPMDSVIASVIQQYRAGTGKTSLRGNTSNLAVKPNSNSNSNSNPNQAYSAEIVAQDNKLAKTFSDPKFNAFISAEDIARAVGITTDYEEIIIPESAEQIAADSDLEANLFSALGTSPTVKYAEVHSSNSVRIKNMTEDELLKELGLGL